MGRLECVALPLPACVSGPPAGGSDSRPLSCGSPTRGRNGQSTRASRRVRRITPKVSTATRRTPRSSKSCTDSHGGSEESEGAPQGGRTTSTRSADRSPATIVSTKTASNMTKPKKTAKPTGSAADFIPPRPTLTKLRAASQGCRGCDLFKCRHADSLRRRTGTRARHGRRRTAGRRRRQAPAQPFVGPSGKLLDRAFDAAGIDRDDVYVTNAVKHFKWAKDARSKRRIHKTPNAGEIRACFPWLAARDRARSSRRSSSASAPRRRKHCSDARSA